MYNEEIYEKLLKKFGEEKMTTVTNVISVFYDIKYDAAKNSQLKDEYDYERQWWITRYVELINQIEVK